MPKSGCGMAPPAPPGFLQGQHPWKLKITLLGMCTFLKIFLVSRWLLKNISQLHSFPMDSYRILPIMSCSENLLCRYYAAAKFGRAQHTSAQYSTIHYIQELFLELPFEMLCFYLGSTKWVKKKNLPRAVLGITGTKEGLKMGGGLGSSNTHQ